MTAGTVYLMRSGDSDHYKIGRTAGAAKDRKRTLATGNPASLAIVKTWELPERHAQFERYLHLLFADRRVVGEDATEFFTFPQGGAAVAARIDAALADFRKRDEREREAAALEQTDDGVCSITSELGELIAERRRLRTQQQLLELRCADVDARIKLLVGGHAGAARPGKAPEVTWQRYTANRFSLADFRAEHPELFARYVKPTSSRRFVVR